MVLCHSNVCISLLKMFYLVPYVLFLCRITGNHYFITKNVRTYISDLTTVLIKKTLLLTRAKLLANRA